MKQDNIKLFSEKRHGVFIKAKTLNRIILACTAMQTDQTLFFPVF